MVPLRILNLCYQRGHLQTTADQWTGNLLAVDLLVDTPHTEDELSVLVLRLWDKNPISLFNADILPFGVTWA